MHPSFAARTAWLLSAMLLTTSTALAVPTSTPTFTAPTTPSLRINEVLASNTRIANAGTFPDIIELHNAGAADVNLAGKSLTDDAALPRKFIFPAGTSIPAGGYLVVYADANASAPGIHTGFSLDAEGDRVHLYETPGAGGALIDSIAFGFQIRDFSISRTGTGANIWALTAPTPGAANGAPTSLSGPEAIKINEWAGKISFRLDHDLIELFNPGAQAVALGGARLTDDPLRLNRFVFPALSFIAANGFLPLFGADFGFGLDGDIDPIILSGENNERIDNVTLSSQARDTSSGRVPDGGSAIANFTVPTPGMSNQTPQPSSHAALLSGLRITELMFQPAAPSNAGDYEFIELQNIGTSTLNLGGVRFTNGIDYTFAAGTTLAPGGFIVVARDRNAFLSRYPSAGSVLAAGSFSGSLDNSGETVALTLPDPWYVHILRFRFEPDWFGAASGGGFSLVIPAPATTAAIDWRERTSWRASAAVNGSPGAADAGTPLPAATARLLNLSTRGLALIGGDQLIPGFVIAGSGTRRLLIRAVGPTLAGFGVSGTIADPQLVLKRFNPTTGAYVDVLSNDNWGVASSGASTPAAITSTTTAVGGFPLTSGSADAAIVVDLAAGQYSALVSGANDGTGVALVELYDASTSGDARLMNIATRGFVGTGGDILISGFVISNEGPKTLLVRAVGPGLAQFGVPGTLIDPQLTIHGRAPGATTNSALVSNNDWSLDSDATTTATVATQVGAFPLQNGSKDAALVVTLPPGDYTVQASGVGETVGVALVEVYVVR